jgi:NAD(P)-dependent dehydrogenase (short-subunit alcohol dehydrogenase family)
MSQQQGPFDLTSLEGQVAVVTGAGNNGIGWGICRHAVAELGMRVAVLDLHESLVAEAAERLNADFGDGTALGVACDVTSPEALSNAVQMVENQFPDRTLGAVFANAGVIFNHTILKSTVEEWKTTLNVNVLGVVNTIQAFVPLLQAQSSESIFVTTASVGGLVRGDGGAASYQASKHAVVALTESLSFEMARKSPQIRFHVLCPCIVGTALGASSRVNAQVASGDMSSADVVPSATGDMLGLAQTPQGHAQQVFDHVAAGRFYMVTENVPPYVDHEFPFDADDIIRERFDGVMTKTLDNSDAWTRGPSGQPTSILKGPLFQELKRRSER